MSVFARLCGALLLFVVLSACQAETSNGGSISADTLLSEPPPNALILDVRSRQEYEGGHIAGAINVPHDELPSRLAELSGGPDRPVVVYCERGGRAGKAAMTLADAGYANVLHLEGDMSGWRSEGRPVE